MRRLALTAVVGVLLLAGCADAVGPSAGPGATPDGVEMAEEPQPDPGSDRLGWENGYWYNDPIAVNNTDGLNESEREAVIARAMARAEFVRQLEFEDDVNITVRTRENASLGGGETNESLRRFDNAKFEAAFYVGEDDDSIAVQDASRNQTVGGFYSPETESIVIVSDAARPRLDGERTLAHELVHALQDQHLNLSVRERAGTRDEFNAITGLIEGDASHAENLYMDRCGGAWDCLNASGGGEGDGPGAPPNWGTYFLEFFPYSDGTAYAASLRAGEGWSAVDEAFRDPPTSAQEVIRPETDGEFEPRDVELADRTDGWERVRPAGRPDYGTLGRSGLAASFARTLYDARRDDPGTPATNASPLVDPQEWLNLEGGGVNESDPLNYDLAVTRGWTGDRMHVYERDGELAYVWRLTWESPAAAERFADGYRDLLTYWGGERVAGSPGEEVWVIREGPFADAFRVRVEGDTVTVTNAPTRGQLDEVRRP